MTDKRPVYLNLLKIRLPLPGVVSFAHRISGVLLFLAIPFTVYLLDLSLQSPQSYKDVSLLLNRPLFLLLQILLLWSLTHHFFAGIRFLLIDAEIGVEKSQARTGAWLVIAAEIITLFVIVLGMCK